MTIHSSGRHSARSLWTITCTSRMPRSNASRPTYRTGNTANISRCFKPFTARRGAGRVCALPPRSGLRPTAGRPRPKLVYACATVLFRQRDQHPEFSDEETFSYCDSRSSVHGPADAGRAGPIDAGYRRDASAASTTPSAPAGSSASGRSARTGSAARSSSPDHDGAPDDHHDHRQAGNRKANHHDREGDGNEEEKVGQVDEPATGDRPFDPERNGAVALSQPGAEGIPEIHSV